MSNLLANLTSSAGSLEAYGRVLEAIQNNVSNASTPGYAKQRIEMYALPFGPAGGSIGGVRAGRVVSARNEFAEQAVRQQTGGLGYQQQLVDSLTEVQSNFDVSGNQGIPRALNNLFQSFTAWGATPDNQAARQSVLDRATDLAQSFRQAANNVSARARDAEQRISQTVDQVNQLVTEIQGCNHIVMQGNKGDSGISTRTHAALDELATLVDFHASFESDGTVSLMLNGETPLLLGDQQFQIGLSISQPQDPPPTNASGPANVWIHGSDGGDITSKTTGAQLGALLHLRNQILPTLIGDAYQAGDLNVMAKQFADRVNQLLTSGNITDGPPAQPGIPLFTYDVNNATNVAASFAVDPGIAADQLAAISPGPPAVSNGVPLALSALANPTDGADKVKGVSFAQFYGQIAGRVGSALNDAQDNQDAQLSLVAQAKSIREQYQGVSLDEEAAILMLFQRAYQATSRFLSVLDQLTETTINIIR